MKLKKLVALILALVTALSLVACGSGGNGSGGGASTDGDTSNFPKMTWSAATSGAEAPTSTSVWRSSASCCRRRLAARSSWTSTAPTS